MSTIYKDLGSVKLLSNSSLNAIVSGVNRNFNLLTNAVETFLRDNEYDEILRTIKFNSLTLKTINLTEKLNIGPDGSEPNLYIDADGRLHGNSIHVDVAVAQRLRLTQFLDDLNTPGIPGEVIYMEPNTTYDEGHYAYYQTMGWVKLGGVAINGGAGGKDYLYELLDVHIVNPQNGKPLIYNSATNKWEQSQFNIGDFFSNLSNLTQYKIPYWNGTSLSDSNASFNPVANSVSVDGDFMATTKSFIIDHPTRENYKLRYGNLEGPEHGVYFRGQCRTKKIKLPEYWKELVDIDSITVNLTPIGRASNLYVKEVTSEYITIAGSNTPHYFFIVFAERKDVHKLVVEVPSFPKK